MNSKIVAFSFSFSIAVFLSFFCCGCETTGSTVSSASNKPDGGADVPAFEEKVAKLKIGMSKSQVISIMGNDYRGRKTGVSAAGTSEHLIYHAGFRKRYVSGMVEAYTFGNVKLQEMDGVMILLLDGKVQSIGYI